MYTDWLPTIKPCMQLYHSILFVCVKMKSKTNVHIWSTVAPQLCHLLITLSVRSPMSASPLLCSKYNCTCEWGMLNDKVYPACCFTSSSVAALQVCKQLKQQATDSTQGMGAQGGVEAHEALLAEASMCEHIVELLCQFEPSAVLPFLQSYDSYRSVDGNSAWPAVHVYTALCR